MKAILAIFVYCFIFNSCRSAEVIIEDTVRPVSVKVKGTPLERERMIELARQTLNKPDTVRITVPNLWQPSTPWFRFPVQPLQDSAGADVPLQP